MEQLDPGSACTIRGRRCARVQTTTTDGCGIPEPCGDGAAGVEGLMLPRRAGCGGVEGVERRNKGEACERDVAEQQARGHAALFACLAPAAVGLPAISLSFARRVGRCKERRGRGLVRGR